MASFKVNDRIGRYIIKERIGRGGMAEVYRAYDTNLERDIAIKVMHAYLSDDGTFRERFEREAKIVAAFNHPHIVRIYDFDHITYNDETLYYMVMPYLSGGTLRDRLLDLQEKNQLMPYNQVHDIVQSLGDALGYAHKRGMVHRDIKPANVMFDENGQVVLTDFGIARWAAGHGLTQEGTTVGTPAYMSPEQAEGSDIDGRSDLYSLGVILYEMLTLHPPFEDDGSLSIILKHFNEPPPSITKFVHTDQHGLDEIIQVALAKNPEDRYQTSVDFVAALSRAFSQPTLELPRIRSDVQPSARAAQAAKASGQRTTTAASPAQNTLAFVTQQITQVVTRSPLGLLIGGLALIGLMTLVGMLTQESAPRENAAVETSVSPTAAVESMTGPLYFVSTFAPDNAANVHWSQESDGFIDREITDDGFYRFANNLSDRAVTSVLDPSYTYDNVSIVLKGALEENSAAASGYGIVFRYINESNYNVFAVDGMGRFSIWARENNQWRELRGESEQWTPNEVIKPLGETNILAVDNFRNIYTGYINNVKVIELEYENAPARGGIGIYLASTPSGTASVLIDSFGVTRLTPSMTDSGG